MSYVKHVTQRLCFHYTSVKYLQCSLILARQFDKSALCVQAVDGMTTEGLVITTSTANWKQTKCTRGTKTIENLSYWFYVILRAQPEKKKNLWMWMSLDIFMNINKHTSSNQPSLQVKTERKDRFVFIQYSHTHS